VSQRYSFNVYRNGDDDATVQNEPSLLTLQLDHLEISTDIAAVSLGTPSLAFAVYNSNSFH
jgi:hypothetical protein